MPRLAKAKPTDQSTATIGFEAKLWLAADHSGDISIYGQDKWARRQRPFGLAKRARRVRLRRQQPKQSNATTRRLAIMNLAIRGIEADIGKEHADTFRNVQHPDLRADYVLATAKRDSALLNAKPHRRACRRQDNPMPFNDSDTALRGSAFLQSEAKPQVVSEAKDNFRKDDDVRWQWSGATWTTRQGCPEGERGGVHQFGVPPKGNANFAWVQHFIHHLAPQGMAGFVLANGSMSSNQSGDCPARSAMKTPKAKPQSLPRQRDIRRALIEADLVDTALRDSAFPQSEATPQVLSSAKNNMVALPGQLFYSTQIPVCLWFGGKNNTLDSANDARLFDGETELSLVA